VEYDTGPDTEGVGRPFAEVFAVFDRIEFVDVGCCHTKCGLDDRCRDAADLAVGVAVDAQGDIAVVGADEAREPLNDPDSACNMTGGSDVGVLRMLAFLVVLAILLCAVSPHVTSHEGVVRAQVYNFCGGDSNLFVCRKLNVLNAESLDTPLEVELRIMQCVVPIRLGPLTESEPVI
jgi:hypothetical protein